MLGTSITVGIVGAALGAMLTGPRVTTVDGTVQTTMPLWTSIAGASPCSMGFFVLYVFVRVLPRWRHRASAKVGQKIDNPRRCAIANSSPYSAHSVSPAPMCHRGIPRATEIPQDGLVDEVRIRRYG